MMSTFYEMGAREKMLRNVFGCGSSRYARAKSGEAPRPRGGTNVNAVNDSMIQ